MTRTPAQAVSTAAALRASERRFARRGVWLMLLLGVMAAAGPAVAHGLGGGCAVLFTASAFSLVFLGMLTAELGQDWLAGQVKGLGRLAAFHDAAIALVAPPAPRIRPAPPAPRIRGRALASLTLAPKLLPRPAATRATARV